MVAAALYLWAVELRARSVLSKEQPSSWQGGTNSPSPKVFFAVFLPDLSLSERDFSLVSVELPDLQLLRREGFESAENSINCLHPDNLNNQKRK